MTGINPLDWYGTEFLILYGVLLVTAVIASFVIANNLRPEGQRTRLAEPDELAVLHAGRERLAEVVAARLLQRGAVKLEKGRFLRQSSSGGGALEGEVLRIGDVIRWGALRKVTDKAASRIEEALERRGLLMGKGERFLLGFYAVTPLALLMLFGLAKVAIGLERDRPVMFLTLLLAASAVALLARWQGTDRRTKAGLAAREDAIAAHSRLQQAHTKDEMGMAVALFGTAILATTPLGELHRLRASSSDGGSGGDSGGDGGGGGGGCGGCGS